MKNDLKKTELTDFKTRYTNLEIKHDLIVSRKDKENAELRKQLQNERDKRIVETRQLEMKLQERAIGQDESSQPPETTDRGIQCERVASKKLDEFRSLLEKMKQLKKDLKLSKDY